MRLAQLVRIITLLPAAGVSAVPSFSSHGYLQHPGELNSPIPPSQGRASPGLWTTVRDSVIESIWGVPKRHGTPPGTNPPATASTAPSSIRARYGDDVVLRFSIRSAGDVKALIEASNILLLDVWSSTDEWVDIRLSKDVVRLVATYLCRMMLFANEGFIV